MYIYFDFVQATTQMWKVNDIYVYTIMWKRNNTTKQYWW